MLASNKDIEEDSMRAVADDNWGRPLLCNCVGQGNLRIPHKRCVFLQTALVRLVVVNLAKGPGKGSSWDPATTFGP